MSQKVIQQYKFIFKKSIHTERVSMTKEWFYTKEKNHKKKYCYSAIFGLNVYMHLHTKRKYKRQIK